MIKFSRHSSLEEKAPSSISGELLKKKYSSPDWHVRWFAIEGSELNWYDDSTAEAPRGSVDLKALIRCDMHPADLRLLLLTPERDVNLKAKSEGEMNMWHRAIEMYADLARGGDGTGMLSTAPRVISRSGPGVHSAEFNHVSRSGKFDISRSGPGMHSMDFEHASKGGKFNPEEPVKAAPVWRSDKMNAFDDGRDLTYDEQEEKDDIFSAEPKPFHENAHVGQQSTGRLISRNKSSMYHSQEVKYPSEHK